MSSYQPSPPNTAQYNPSAQYSSPDFKYQTLTPVPPLPPVVQGQGHGWTGHSYGFHPSAQSPPFGSHYSSTPCMPTYEPVPKQSKMDFPDSSSTSQSASSTSDNNSFQVPSVSSSSTTPGMTPIPPGHIMQHQHHVIGNPNPSAQSHPHLQQQLHPNMHLRPQHPSHLPPTNGHSSSPTTQHTHLRQQLRAQLISKNQSALQSQASLPPHPPVPPPQPPQTQENHHIHWEGQGSMSPGGDSPNGNDKSGKKKRKRCGECPGCIKKDNCGSCGPCKSVRSHQICKMRKCDQLKTKKEKAREVRLVRLFFI